MFRSLVDIPSSKQSRNCGCQRLFLLFPNFAIADDHWSLITDHWSPITYAYYWSLSDRIFKYHNITKRRWRDETGKSTRFFVFTRLFSFTNEPWNLSSGFELSIRVPNSSSVSRDARMRLVMRSKSFSPSREAEISAAIKRNIMQLWCRVLSRVVSCLKFCRGKKIVKRNNERNNASHD